MAERVPGLGKLTDTPRAVEDPSFDGLQLGPEDWFLLSRIDGSTSISELFNLSPKGRDATIEILKRLAEHDLIELDDAGDEAGSQEKRRVPTGSTLTLPTPPEGWPTPWDSFEPDAEMMESESALDSEMKRFVLYYHEHLEKISYYDLLGVAPDASAGKIKRAYFKLSKVFHPDRFFRQDLGAFGPLLNEVFRWLNDTRKTLINTRRRGEYDELLGRGLLGPWQQSDEQAPQTPGDETRFQRPLAELLGEGKRLEREGEYAEAAEFYEAALGQRRSAELMNRVAECLIRTRDNLDLAETRAREAVELAPETARYQVALAYIRELKGHTDDAIAGYRRALEIDPSHKGARTRLSRLNAS